MAIVSTPGTLDGRWRIDGTRLDVMMLRTNPRSWLLEQYEHVPITNEMIDEALAWTFPAIQQPTIEIDAFTRTCECGESYWYDAVDHEDEPITAGEHVFTCEACGKRWSLTIKLEQDWKPVE